MPFFIQPFFRKPFKLFAIDADTGQPLDPNVRKKTRVTYYELETGSNGSKRLIAHKTPSQVSKQAEAKTEDNAKSAEEAKKGGGDDSEELKWTEEQDKTIIAMKAEGKTWAQIGQEVGGRTKAEVSARFKEINPDKGKTEDAGEKENGGGDAGGNNQGEQTKEKNKGGKEQSNSHGQGKKNQKGNNQNKNNNQQKNANKQNNNKQNNNKNQNNQQNNNKKDDKDKNQNANSNQNKHTSKPASKHSNSQPTKNGEARFTMNDWLTLHEDDIFSFGELQCLSELIAKDMNQGWQRVAAKFFDLTGRRVHPDDVREKFESMAVAAAGGKK
jgi:hypothetical protein